MNEIHRYFPDWADLPTGPDPQREADRNSYLAGGYADEFGYRTQPDQPPAIVPLDGDPESSSLWREQVGALHPGYPQCPKPLDRENEPRDVTDHPAPAGQSRDGRDGSSRVQMRRVKPDDGVAGFRVVTVSRRNHSTLGHVALHVGFFAFVAERLIRRRHLNDVL
jgi:hypothetical protein